MDKKSEAHPVQHDMSEYLEKHMKKYLVVNSVCRRVRDLQSGFKALVPVGGKSLDEVALEELRQSKLVVTTLDDVEGVKRKYTKMDITN